MPSPLTKHSFILIALICLAGCSWPTNNSATAKLSSPYFDGDTAGKLPIGKNAAFAITVNDPERGVCALQAALVQAANVVPLTLTPQTATAENSPKSLVYNVALADLADTGLIEGDAQVVVDEQNCSLFKGKTRVILAATVDYTPPRVSLTSQQHYINQAGADVATYVVDDDPVWSGVTVGSYEFRGYPKPGVGTATGEHFAFFAYPYDLTAGTPIAIKAVDAAGNVGTATLVPSKFFPKEFRKRDIAIDDEFIQTKVADIIANTPELKRSGDNLADFIAVNRDLRKVDANFLFDLAKKSAAQFYWKDAFTPLKNASIEASFADYRTYFYGGEKVDEQVHLGFDMAITEHAPITAAANGKVAFAGYFGIYGNAVILDHGYGLMSLYAHLSEIAVQNGNTIKQDQLLGKSGATGLAGGDHLHYSMLIQGVQVNPVEFWDQHWIKDHVYLRLDDKMFGQL